METFAGEERTTTTGTVNVPMTPSQWIEASTRNYVAMGGKADTLPDARTRAIMDFLDLHLKNIQNK